MRNWFEKLTIRGVELVPEQTSYGCKEAVSEQWREPLIKKTPRAPHRGEPEVHLQRLFLNIIDLLGCKISPNVVLNVSPAQMQKMRSRLDDSSILTLY